MGFVWTRCCPIFLIFNLHVGFESKNNAVSYHVLEKATRVVGCTSGVILTRGDSELRARLKVEFGRVVDTSLALDFDYINRRGVCSKGGDHSGAVLLAQMPPFEIPSRTIDWTEWLLDRLYSAI